LTAFRVVVPERVPLPGLFAIETVNGREFLMRFPRSSSSRRVTPGDIVAPAWVSEGWTANTTRSPDTPMISNAWLSMSENPAAEASRV